MNTLHMMSNVSYMEVVTHKHRHSASAYWSRSDHSNVSPKGSHGVSVRFCETPGYFSVVITDREVSWHFFSVETLEGIETRFLLYDAALPSGLDGTRLARLHGAQEVGDSNPYAQPTADEAKRLVRCNFVTAFRFRRLLLFFTGRFFEG